MREKSQLEDMRAAIRGDIERARARREADPWRTPEAEKEPRTEPEVAAQPEAEPEPEPAAAATEDEIEPLPSAPPATEPPAPAKTRFLSRIFGRG